MNRLDVIRDRVKAINRDPRCLLGASVRHHINGHLDEAGHARLSASEIEQLRELIPTEGTAPRREARPDHHTPAPISIRV